MISNIDEFITLAEKETGILESLPFKLGMLGIFCLFVLVILLQLCKSYKIIAILRAICLAVLVIVMPPSVYIVLDSLGTYISLDSENSSVKHMENALTIETQIKKIIAENDTKEAQVEKIYEYLDKEKFLGDIAYYKQENNIFKVDLGASFYYAFVLSDNSSE